jgi:hypothetical protein
MAKGPRQTATKLSQAAKKVITLAATIRAYYDTDLPKRYLHYPIIAAGEEGPPPPPEERTLEQFLGELPHGLLNKLILVMYLGRGDFGVEDLADVYDDLRQTLSDPKWAASQMMEKTPLADYLADGLAQLEEHGIDVDHLPLRED